jgi:hypothetical protein
MGKIIHLNRWKKNQPAKKHKTRSIRAKPPTASVDEHVKELHMFVVELESEITSLRSTVMSLLRELKKRGITKY